MEREKDLCIKILQFVEKNQASYEDCVSDNIKIKNHTTNQNYTTSQIVYHIDLLDDNGLVEVETMSTMSNSWRAIKRITNVGHDFLDEIRE